MLFALNVLIERRILYSSYFTGAFTSILEL